MFGSVIANGLDPAIIARMSDDYLQDGQHSLTCRRSPPASATNQ